MGGLKVAEVWKSSMNAASHRIEPANAACEADELPAGTRLLSGQYRIESFLNSGGFGIVYTAIDSLDRRVVVKECFPSAFCRRIDTVVAPSTRSKQEDFQSIVQLFLQEAFNLSKLDHPGIVKVHQVFEENDTAYMAMDYIKGPDLLQTVEGTAAPLTPKEVIAHLHKVLDAVGYLHGQGLLHRDISPDNIILDAATNQPVLIDFGASRKDVTRKSRAISGLRVVKDGYSPQEFYVSGSAQGPFSDLYALAASFYHLITRETPKTSQERLSAIAGGEGDPLRPLAGRFRAYPPAFLEAIDKAMAIFPRDRLQSVQEWQAILETGAPAPLRAEAKVVAVPAPARQARPVLVPAPQPAPVVGAEQTTVSPAAPMAAANPVAAPAAAAQPLPVVAQPGIGRGTRDILVGAIAAVVLLVGLLSLPTDLFSRGSAVASPDSTVAAGETLALTDTLRLPGGLAFEVTEGATGPQTVVAEIPNSVATSLQVGDVLLVYTATGEALDSSGALRNILQREFVKGVTTYNFVIRRGVNTIDATFRLGVAG